MSIMSFSRAVASQVNGGAILLIHFTDGLINHPF